ncbi:unnamed protein product [Closterium sp. Naga37s-1]|nr:unnamed protein product [Closterium sp. Naga37s-1]
MPMRWLWPSLQWLLRNISAAHCPPCRPMCATPFAAQATSYVSPHDVVGSVLQHQGVRLFLCILTCMAARRVIDGGCWVLGGGRRPSCREVRGPKEVGWRVNSSPILVAQCDTAHFRLPVFPLCHPHQALLEMCAHTCSRDACMSLEDGTSTQLASRFSPHQADATGPLSHECSAAKAVGSCMALSPLALPYSLPVHSLPFHLSLHSFHTRPLDGATVCAIHKSENSLSHLLAVFARRKAKARLLSKTIQGSQSATAASQEGRPVTCSFRS